MLLDGVHVFQICSLSYLGSEGVVVCGTKDFFQFAGAPAKRTLSTKLLSPFNF